MHLIYMTTVRRTSYIRAVTAFLCCFVFIIKTSVYFCLRMEMWWKKNLTLMLLLWPHDVFLKIIVLIKVTTANDVLTKLWKEKFSSHVLCFYFGILFEIWRCVIFACAAVLMEMWVLNESLLILWQIYWLWWVSNFHTLATILRWTNLLTLVSFLRPTNFPHSDNSKVNKFPSLWWDF